MHQEPGTVKTRAEVSFHPFLIIRNKEVFHKNAA